MSMKLFGRETGQSVTLFEQTVPAGSKNSWLHLHRDSDEIAWVLEGEFTFKIGETVTTGGPGTCAFLPRNLPHAWKNSSTQPGQVVFLYTPAGAGRFVEGMLERSAEGDLKERLQEFRLGSARAQSALSQDLADGRNLGVFAVEQRQRELMHVLGGPQPAGQVALVARPAGIGRQAHAEPEIGGVAHRRLDGVGEQHAADDQRRPSRPPAGRQDRCR